jgi:magnesium transporter
VNNQLNVVMKRLTIITATFMPGTLIAGIYGMNLRLWPAPLSRFGFAFALALIVGITGSMLIWFKESDWW